MSGIYKINKDISLAENIFNLLYQEAPLDVTTSKMLGTLKKRPDGVLIHNVCIETYTYPNYTVIDFSEVLIKDNYKTQWGTLKGSMKITDSIHIDSFMERYKKCKQIIQPRKYQ